ncbi:cellulose biosynthesis cyclic di-GMP-binding regulatory protein BcsB [Oricola thermophila]|uniref:Cyclic di-GMP-binding protein n=1 Tax=Oricola thermophila TaxID=2742145 RepID=A0A6N1VCC2_9HYPH|nr:cellulose biosynthesis cyclic di-GMP-binding regulatory protein BcsB [Oricola thermophila]QKV18520.1 cellulose biosynthesis cyclic di-GMP-binding regulatory protein BcsB [Oricola thermophila]
MAGNKMALLLAGAVASLAVALPAAAQEGFSLDIPVATNEPAPSRALKPIAADSRDLFFSGESNFREFAFFAMPEETAGDIKLVLNLQSAISNTPEQSRMAVYVNDVELGVVQLASGEPRTIELPVKPGIIQPGFNAVTFLVDQFHRVDCSVVATYELWTQIDPARSGFAFSATPGNRSDFADLAAVARAVNGRTAIRAVLPDGAAAWTASLLAETIQAVSVAAHYDQPHVEFAEDAGSGPGVDVVIGTPETVREIYGEIELDIPNGSGIVVSRAPGDDRIRLFVLGRSPEDIRRHIDTLHNQSARTESRGTAPGMRAFRKLEGRILEPGTVVSLADLGINMRTFTGRHFRQSVNFEMPDDFYPGDYGRASIRLNALYAAGLSKGADLIVKLNDIIVSNISLGASRDGVIDEQQLPIPFSAFRPGENTLAIEARLPAPSDQVCDPTRIGGGSGRLRILPSSYLEMPDFARIGRYPDLATLNASLSEFVGRDGSEPLPVLVPQSDRAAMNAAATFLAKLAYASGTVFRTEFVSSVPFDESRPLIAFGTYNSLPFDFLSKMNIDFSLAPNLDAETAPIGGGQSTPFPSDFADTVQQREAETISTGPRRLLESGVRIVRNTIDSTTELFSDMRDGAYRVAGLFGLAAPDVPSSSEREPPFSPSRTANLVIAQRHNPTGDATWTLVAAQREDQLADAVLTLTHRSVWSRIGGSILSIADTGEIVDKVEAKNTTLFLTQPSTVTNSRLVIAGWLSNNSDKYVVAVMGVFSLLGLFTHLLLRIGRNRRR